MKSPPLYAVRLGLIAATWIASAYAQQDGGSDARAPDDVAGAIDAYIDARYDGDAKDTAALLDRLKRAGRSDPEAIEALLRAPRHTYPSADDLVGKTTVHEVSCVHVDYASEYLLFVPATYAHETATPLVVVGHGGNSSMPAERAKRVAESYLNAYAPALSKAMGAIVVAPASSRGWGHIGNSLILSTISDVQRRLHVDPDRIYVTGQSMGGHMSFRAALSLPDRFAAVSPQSGGYDFVAKNVIGNLINVPGYVTWGKREPYGIDKDSRTNAAWAREHGLDWVFVEKDGGHEIYQDELPAIAKFFTEHPRNLYRKEIYLRQGGSMRFERTWGIKGWPEHHVYSDERPLRWNLRHWLEVAPRPKNETPITVHALAKANNRFEVHSDQLREFSIYLHPRLIDFSKPVEVFANGKKAFAGRVEPDPALMLELAREFDDRGRIFWARIRLSVDTDEKVELAKKRQ
ncbi:MAG: prolyl oligopeptidase family serine peptidase [Planctomycetes bacterium]|nr:prolyl oligopeptidase family serine peptidase [Planctomycetota bacterium]